MSIENLTPFNKHLFWKAHEIRTTQSYKYLHTQKVIVTLKKKIRIYDLLNLDDLSQR